jgi:diadenosine tetraphosphatase ApaH/serine/threonine PP2A family protein phosphatase
VLAIGAGRKGAPRPRHPAKQLAFAWAYRQLTPAHRRWIAALPGSRRRTLGGQRCLLTHGSPESDTEYIYSATPLHRLRHLARAAEADIIVCGHAHRPFARKVANVWFINTGSVGRPDDGDPRACYAILEMTSGRIKVRHMRLAYAVRQTVAALRRRKLPAVFGQMLEQGVDLETAQQRPAEPGPDKSAPAANADPEMTRAAVRRFAQACHYARAHTEQVTRLALDLFDALRPLHRLGPTERLWLEWSARLHDIGWLKGRKGHHKTALRLILATSSLPFDLRQRLIIGSIARYHRRAGPSLRHDHFRALSGKDRRSVCRLAAILRLADGLDALHTAAVQSVSCRLAGAQVRVAYQLARNSAFDAGAARKKGRLLEKIFRRQLKLADQGQTC